MFVKICGITSIDDALVAAGLGTDAVGLVFAASPRRVTAAIARDIVRMLPPEVLSVGVFRNESPSRVVEIANTVGLRAVQLHGNESPEDTAWIAARVPSVIRAFSVTDSALERFDDYGAERLLIDAARPGSGETFDWAALKDRNIQEPYVLAGGLNPSNVAAAISRLAPWGVDVSSGVERGPGRKDAVKMRKFINEVRSQKVDPQPQGSKPFDWEVDGVW